MIVKVYNVLPTFGKSIVLVCFWSLENTKQKQLTKVAVYDVQ